MKAGHCHGRDRKPKSQVPFGFRSGPEPVERQIPSNSQKQRQTSIDKLVSGPLAIHPIQLFNSSTLQLFNSFIPHSAIAITPSGGNDRRSPATGR